jgi:hypothetical protein
MPLNIPLQEQSGHELDWRALGYSHLETLLKKLDDVAEIRYVHDMYCVYAKDDGMPVRTDLLLPPLPPPTLQQVRSMGL